MESRQRIRGTAVTLLAVSLALSGSVFAADEGGVDEVLGTWNLVTQTPTGPVNSEVTVEHKDSELAVTEATAGPATEVSFADGVLTFVLTVEGRQYRVMVEVEGDSMDGKMFVGGASFRNFDEMYETAGKRRAEVSGDVAAIADVINRWAEAGAAKDIDAMMELFSEDFRSDILPDKVQLREYWQLAIENGMTEDMKVRFDPKEIEVDGDTAKTGRVYYQAKPGGYFQIMDFKKEDEVWRITNSYS
jgi:ketosteroid isomerase-like protein